MKEEEILKIFKQFVEHTITLREFKSIYMSSKDMQDYSSKIFRELIDKKYNHNLNDFILNHRWTDYYENLAMQLDLLGVLLSKNITAFKSPYYREQADKFSSIFPDWLSDDALDYLDENVVNKLPENMKESERKKIIKLKIKELFQYEKKPPEFVQSGHWPQDEEGTFLTFRKQKEEGEKTTYTFVNKKTNKEVEYEEFL